MHLFRIGQANHFHRYTPQRIPYAAERMSGPFLVPTTDALLSGYRWQAT
jgi:hypothetical protein